MDMQIVITIELEDGLDNPSSDLLETVTCYALDLSSMGEVAKVTTEEGD